MSITTGKPRRRALFVAYTFPPVGGAGVQRTTKFVKYLPEFGWDASVLTVSNPSVPLRDHTLCQDVPPSTRIVRARTFEPSYAAKAALAAGALPAGQRSLLTRALHRAAMAMLQPDPQILWNVPAYRAGRQLLREEAHDVIVASAPPFSSLLLGAALSGASKIPLVLDYRDEWDVSNRHWENRQVRGLSAVLQRHMERFGLKRARLVIATSPRSATALKRLCREARSSAHVTHLYNGFDAQDFAPSATPRSGADKSWRLVYTGTLYSLMSPVPLVDAIERLAARDPRLASRIELVFAGRHAAEQSRQLARADQACRLNRRDYISHPDAIALMRSADALCVLLSDVAGAARIIPAKLFEYIASHKPILAIAPRGDVWDLLQSHPAAFTFAPGDVDRISDWLARAVAGSIPPVQLGTVDTRPFERRAQAQRLAALLDPLVATRTEVPAPMEEVACSA